MAERVRHLLVKTISHLSNRLIAHRLAGEVNVEPCYIGAYDSLLAAAKARLSTTQRLGRMMTRDKKKTKTTMISYSIVANQAVLRCAPILPENYLTAAFQLLPGARRGQRRGTDGSLTPCLAARSTPTMQIYTIPPPAGSPAPLSAPSTS